ncbi:MAG: LptE family protein [Candidatus Aminicenantes bacterium]|nr:LptE family protein [Candidatus Aminicenantes bacterium]
MGVKKILLLFFIFADILFLFYCGYHLSGVGSQVPDHIKTIFIPNFKNRTSLSRAEQFVTFAIREEFIRRSRLELVEDISESDSSLEGEISSFEVKPLSITKAAQSNLYNLRIRLSVKFIDLKNNRIIYQGKGISFSQQYEIDTGDFFTLASEAIEKIAGEFASSIVSIILENF